MTLKRKSVKLIFRRIFVCILLLKHCAAAAGLTQARGVSVGKRRLKFNSAYVVFH